MSSSPPPHPPSDHQQQQTSPSPLKKGFKFRAQDFVSHRQDTSNSHHSHHSNSHSKHSLQDELLDENNNTDLLDDEEFFDRDYEMLHYLGQGRNGKSQVFCCKHRGNGELRAVKVWRKSRRNPRRSTAITAGPLVDFEFENVELDSPTNETPPQLQAQPPYNPDLVEFYHMKNLHYPNVAKIFELLEGPTHYYMVMEYGGGGTMRDDLLRQPGERYPEDKAAGVIAILLKTVTFLHSSSVDKKSIIHADLNLTNVVLDSDKEKMRAIKLIDFGDAVVDTKDDFNTDDDNVDWYEPRGAQLPFMSPEMLSFDQKMGKPSDLWSLGVMAYVLVSGKYPFGDARTTSFKTLQDSIHTKLALGREDDDDDDEASDLLFPSQDLVWKAVSQTAKDFIRSLLQYHPDDRPTAEEAIHHLWMDQTRQRAFKDKLAGGGSHQHTHLKEHAQEVWSGLKQTARRRKSSPKVLKHAALTFIATQLVLKEEKQHIDEVFQWMDVQSDGVLTRDEVRRGYQAIFGKELKDSDLQVLFDKVDLGGNGTIEYSEFVIATLNEKQLLHTTKLRQAFDAFDTDGTGFISAANLRPLLQSYLAEHNEEDHVSILEQIIAQVDTDGDGQISLEEFVAMMLHSSSGDNHGRRRATQRLRKVNHGVAASLTTSMLMVEPPNVFASTTSAMSPGKRKSLWESSVNLTFRPEHMIGKRSEKLTSQYDIGEYIQSGSFGSVWFCHHKVSGAERAVKYVKKSKVPRENEMILREFNILRSLDHPNILKMYELFEDNEHYEIVMDVCKGGDLCDEIDTYGAIDETGACLILHQILMCVNYCHQRHIVHCDLKPDNILLEENKSINQMKIIDFGLAIDLVGEQEREEMSVVNGRIREMRGTLRFMAPEVLARNYGPKCDVWACGVIAFLLLSDNFPFNGKDKLEICVKIKSGVFYFGDPIWGSISRNAKSFISKCLTVNEEQRPSAEEALQHPWLQTARDAVTQNFNHKEVPSAAQALDNMKRAPKRCVLYQAVSTFIVSQLIMKEEKAKIDEVFRVMDVACDGKLSKQEVKDGYLKVFGCELTDDEVDDMFDRIDIDCTGYLEYGEFVAGAICQEDLFKNNNLKKAFQVFDTNNRGYISKGSLKRGLTKFLGDDSVNDEIIRKIMSQVDRDGDGRISYDEFLATMLNVADVPLAQPAKQEGLLGGFTRLFYPKK